MKKISRILRYLKDYKGQIALYFLFSLLAVLFSLMSLGMLAPIMDVIFKQGTVAAAKNEGLTGEISGLIQSIVAESGKATALMYVCIAAVVFTLLKNVFLYSGLYVLNPLRNAILRR